MRTQRKTKHRLRTIWRLPDDLWAELEPLLPPEKPPARGAAPPFPFAKSPMVFSTSCARAVSGRRSRANTGLGQRARYARPRRSGD